MSSRLSDTSPTTTLLSRWRRLVSKRLQSSPEEGTEDVPLLERRSTAPALSSNIFGSSSSHRRQSSIFANPPEVCPALPDEDPPEYTSASNPGTAPADGPSRPSRAYLDPAIICPLFISVGWTIGVFLAYPFPTTIHVYIGLLVFMFGWTVLRWIRLLSCFLRERTDPFPLPSTAVLAVTSVLVFVIAIWGFRIPVEPLPTVDITTQKYLIGANLYNNEEIMSRWTDQLEKLIFHLGRDNVFVSIYESNSVDKTKLHLDTLNTTLSNLHVAHRIIATQDNRPWWPYNTSPERIDYLASARNKVLEPLQHPDPDIRVDNYQDYAKIIFLNDVLYDWRDIVRLIATGTQGDQADGSGYDMACGLDFGASGLYDTWVARDICGAPLRPFWPYTDDPVSVELLRTGQPFPVAACWNGVVVFQAAPYLYRPVQGTGGNNTAVHARGWKMVDDDTFPGSVPSPELSLPIKFRSSGIQACDHSECFLWSYDLHRLYDHPSRPPRIYINPDVQVAYDDSWFRWHHTVLRWPVIRFWVRHWSRGGPFKLVGWLWRMLAKRRDYCTWAALSSGMPERCPPLPGPPKDISWDARR